MLRFHVAAIVAVQVLICLAARSASAQLPSLSDFDAINASAQTGMIVPDRYSTVPDTAELTGLWGFGVETELELPVGEGSNWEGTLGVGYNYLNLDAELGAGRRLRGGLRDLPALTLYFGRKGAPVYFGVGVAISELKDGRLHQEPAEGQVDPGPITVSGTALSPAISMGKEWGPVFFEVGYVGRLFPSVAYGGYPSATGFPADLGERLYTGGLMFRLGGTLSLKKEAVTKEDKVPCGKRTVTVVHAKDQTIEPKCYDGQLIIDFIEPPPKPKSDEADATSNPLSLRAARRGARGSGRRRRRASGRRG